MRGFRSITLVALSLLALPLTSAQAGVFIGVGVPGPYYRCRPYWYGPRVVVTVPVGAVYAPGTVYVTQPPTVVYTQAPTVVTVPATPTVVTAPAPGPTTAPPTPLPPPTPVPVPGQ